MMKRILRSLVLMNAALPVAALAVLSSTAIANATELGAEGRCDSYCQQAAQQGLILCQQLENSLNAYPNDPNLQIGYNNCLAAIQKQGFCNVYHTTDMLEGKFDVRDCNIHLSDFYFQESPRW